MLHGVKTLCHGGCRAGYGSLVTLPDADHIDVCKPLSRDDAAYSKVRELLDGVLARAAAAREPAADEIPELSEVEQ